MKIQGLVNYTEEAGNVYEAFFIEKYLREIGKWTNSVNYSVPEFADNSTTNNDNLSIPLLDINEISIFITTSVIVVLIKKKREIVILHKTNDGKK